MKILMYLIVCILFPGAIKAQYPEVLGGTFEFNTSGKQTISIPLKLEGNSQVTFLSKTPFSVRNGNISTDSFLKAIVYEWEPKRSLLKLTIDPDLLNVYGEYDVVLRYNIVGAERPKYLAFKLSRPEATITANSINIHEQGCERRNDPLVIIEGGGKVGARDIKISSCYVPGILNGDLIKLPTDVSVMPGSQVKISYEIDPKLFDRLPLGETKGKLQLTTKSIKAPLQVEVTITKKRSKWLIVLTIFVGLFTGAIVRNYLKDKKDRDHARLLGFQLIRDISTYAKGVEDAKFQKTMNTIVQGLLLAVSPSNRAVMLTGATTISNSIQTASDEYKKEKGRFENALITTKASYEDSRKIFFTTPRTPRINKLLNPVQQNIINAGERLAVFDQSGADILLDEAKTQAKRAIDDYGSYANGLITFLISPANYMPAVLTTDDIASDVQSLAQAAKDKFLQNFSMGITDISGALDAADNIQKDFDNALSELKKIESAFAKVNSQAAIHPAFLPVVQKWFDAIQAMLLNTNDMRQSSLYWNSEILKELDAAWQKAIQASATKLGSSSLVVNTVGNLIGHLFEGSSLIDPETELKDLELDQIDSNYQRTYNIYLVSDLIQLLVYTLLIGLGGYIAYGPRFIGLTEEFITIFLFAFSLDITADSVSRLSAKQA